MGKLKRGHIIETSFWLAFAAFLFYFTFDFNQEMSNYRFGASGWPRTVIGFIVIAALGNLFYHWRYGDDDGAADRPGMQQDMSATAAEDARVAAEESMSSYLARMLPVLFVPFVFAYFMRDLGFYTLAPLFAASIIYLLGERRILPILGVTALVYGLILFLFVKVLPMSLPRGFRRPFYDFSNWLEPAIQNNQALEFFGIVLVIPIAITALLKGKGAETWGAAFKKAAPVYAVLFAAGVAASYLLGGTEKMFVLFDVLRWPLTLL